MSEEIGHFCGIALIRLKSHYLTIRKIWYPIVGFQSVISFNGEAAQPRTRWCSIGSMKLNVDAGEAFMFRERSTSSKALAKIFDQQNKILDKLIKRV